MKKSVLALVGLASGQVAIRETCTDNAQCEAVMSAGSCCLYEEMLGT